MLQTMFVELDLPQKFNIPLPILRNFLYEVYNNYNEVPFHNFRHCFCVAQMASIYIYIHTYVRTYISVKTRCAFTRNEYKQRQCKHDVKYCNISSYFHSNRETLIKFEEFSWKKREIPPSRIENNNNEKYPVADVRDSLGGGSTVTDR